MRSRITVSIFSVMTAVLSLSIGGCSGDNSESTADITQSNIEQPINSTDSSSAAESSESSSESSDENSSAETEPADPRGEPTILVGLDGETIYTSEITKVLDIHGDFTTVDQITADNDGVRVFCDGFQYFKEPEGTAYDNYNNPELFDGMEFVGEIPVNNNKYRRVNVGDKICGLTLVEATTQFLIDPSGYEENHSYYYPDVGDYGVFMRFEGMVTIEGFMSSSARNSYEPDGGALRFTPIENKLPILGSWFGLDVGFFVTSAYNTNELLCFTEMGEISPDKPTCDLGNLGIGDIMYVRATFSDIRYIGDLCAAKLENMEILSDVLVHVDDSI